MNFIKKFIVKSLIAILIIAVNVQINCLISVASEVDDEILKVWNEFLNAISTNQVLRVNSLISKDATEAFLKGINEQLNSKDKSGIDVLRKIKYVKTYKVNENIIKLGFEVPSKIPNGEYLWIVFKKEKSGYKILALEPTYSLKFYEIILKLDLLQNQKFNEVASKVVDVLKKRLKENKYTNFNFIINYENEEIKLEISGIDTEQSFKNFITHKGYFSVRQVLTDEEAKVKPHELLYEYQYVDKKEVKSYKVAKEEIINNSGDDIKNTEVTYSGFRVPQIQIDVNLKSKVKLEKFTEELLKNNTNYTLACVLDHKILFLINNNKKISSGRIWIENITFVHTANMLNAIISAGPLPCLVNVKSFKEI